MPRKARIDAPGALHHIIGRGIERRKIFDDNADRENFLERIEVILSETSTPCYGWVLMPNHFHLVLRTGKAPISTVMRRLLTGYATSFNLRHRRNGHLFQNRFKSILCQEDLYLKQLVGYVHLNPLRAGIVDDLKALSRYPYSGHSVLMGMQTRSFQDVNFVLEIFGSKVSSARRNYRNYVHKNIGYERRPELVGGGLLRSNGGWGVIKSLSRARIHLKGDERILGESDFVTKVLADQKERFERRYWLEAQGYDLDRVVGKVAEIFDVEPETIWRPGNQPLRVKVRSLVCYWSVRELGLSGASVGKVLGLSQSAVSRAVVRGEKVCDEMNLRLDV